MGSYIILCVFAVAVVAVCAALVVENVRTWDTINEPDYHGSYSYGSLSCNFVYCYMSDIMKIKDLECSNNSLSTLEKIEAAEKLIEKHIRADLLDLKEA